MSGFETSDRVMSITSYTQSIIDGWASSLEHQISDSSDWGSKPENLISSARLRSFNVGNGTQVTNSITSKCTITERELIITTCFWAKSSSQKAISSLLLNLSAKALDQNRKIYVWLCFSSLSLTQKLLQTSSPDGKYYPQSSWAKLNLPAPDALTGLNLVVKSIFIRPISVMHPKFVIVDRRRAFMPSCNVSWENWFEGCIELEGDVVDRLFRLWQKSWASSRDDSPILSLVKSDAASRQKAIIETEEPRRENDPTSNLRDLTISGRTTLTTIILLPSSYHINPRFSLCSSHIPPAPSTPLNTFLLYIFNHAKLSIYIQTANFTSRPVSSALISAISRGVNVHLITNRRLMIYEQLLTAGTTTAVFIRKLKHKYHSVIKNHLSSAQASQGAVPIPGKLKIGYYEAHYDGCTDKDPLMSHLKMTIVDNSISVLGSGNMDRASWYTSQELGIAIMDENLTREIEGVVQESLKGKIRYIC